MIKVVLLFSLSLYPRFSVTFISSHCLSFLPIPFIHRTKYDEWDTEGSADANRATEREFAHILIHACLSLPLPSFSSSRPFHDATEIKEAVINPPPRCSEASVPA